MLKEDLDALLTINQLAQQAILHGMSFLVRVARFKPYPSFGLFHNAFAHCQAQVRFRKILL